MIEIIEKEPFSDDSPYYARTRVPIFMRKDGKDYFVANRLVSDSEPGGWGNTHVKVSEIEIRRYKEHLQRTDGRYYKMYGTFDDPMELIEEIKKNGYTLWCLGQPIEYSKRIDSARFVDFHGNTKEYSAAFHYRIYDQDLIDRLCDAVIELMEGEEPA